MTAMHATQGQIIETRLAQLGMTVYRLAKITGMDESNLRNVINGKKQPLATAETIDPIVDALQMDSADPLYLAAGKVPPDVTEILLRHPDYLDIIRHLASMEEET